MPDDGVSHVWTTQKLHTTQDSTEHKGKTRQTIGAKNGDEAGNCMYIWEAHCASCGRTFGNDRKGTTAKPLRSSFGVCAMV